MFYRNEMFDFNRDGEMDRREFVIGMELERDLLDVEDEDEEDDFDVDEIEDEDGDDEDDELLQILEDAGLDFEELEDMDPEDRIEAIEDEGLDVFDFKDLFDDWEDELEEKELIEELEDAGLDFDELEDMDPDERIEAIEDKGLDVSDYWSLFDDWDDYEDDDDDDDDDVCEETGEDMVDDNNSGDKINIGVGVYRAGSDIPVGLLKLKVVWVELSGPDVLCCRISSDLQEKIDRNKDTTFIDQIYVQVKEGEYLMIEGYHRDEGVCVERIEVSVVKA